jgi:large subunit ribosomal protein L25
VKQVNISAGLRAEFGKGAAKRLRRSGLIPAILYGRETEPIALNLSPLDLRKAAGSGTKGSVLIDLSIEGGEETQNRTVMLKKLQTHPVTGNHLHADFYEIAMDEKIVMPVSIRLIGRPKGLKLGVSCDRLKGRSRLGPYLPKFQVTLRWMSAI